MNPFSRITRRTAITGLIALVAERAFSQAPRGTLPIGYQKSSILMTVLKVRGSVEQQLAPLKVQVSWHEFASGLLMLESLNVGSIDFSADVADTVLLSAQATGANPTYVAQKAPSASAQAIIVKADSKIRRVADLKGKKGGFAKGAGAHYLLLVALEQAGVAFKDIEAAYLAPADGRTAFEKGAIDAWVIWDPFLAAVQRQSTAQDVALFKPGA